MVKSSIGELKLSPLKEEGMFVFYNDSVKINGKTSKGDSVKIFVRSYQQEASKCSLNISEVSKAVLTVRGIRHTHENIAGYGTLEMLYEHISGLYKDHFYFGDSKVEAQEG